MQFDWIGDQRRKPFKDIRNTRDPIAEREAELCLLLKERLRRVPPIMSSASVDQVRYWKNDHKHAAKVCADKRASVADLESALGLLETWLMRKA